MHENGCSSYPSKFGSESGGGFSLGMRHLCVFLATTRCLATHVLPWIIFPICADFHGSNKSTRF